MITDETIYQQYLRGETNAADLLVERYGDMLTLYINGYIKDIHEAEDLMIEAFSQIFAKKSVLLRERAVSRHIFTKQPATLPCGIAKNTATSSCGLMIWILNCQIKPWLRPGPFKMSGTDSFMKHWIN